MVNEDFVRRATSIPQLGMFLQGQQHHGEGSRLQSGWAQAFHLGQLTGRLLCPQQSPAAAWSGVSVKIYRRTPFRSLLDCISYTCKRLNHFLSPLTFARRAPSMRVLTLLFNFMVHEHALPPMS